MAKGERKEQLKKEYNNLFLWWSDSKCSMCAGWEPSTRAGFPVGHTDLDYQSKLGLRQMDVMPDVSAEPACFA